jgi:hypothetical protein
VIKLTKSYFKKIYKIIIFYFFYLAYSKPKNYKKSLKGYKEINVKIDKKNYKIFEFKKGRIYTNKNDITAYITRDNHLTKASLQFKKFDDINSFNQSIKKNEVLNIGTPKLKKKIYGSVLSLLSGGAARDNFTHWFTDVIPRIFLYKKKFNIKKIDKLYIPSFKYRFQIETLHHLGFDKDKLISSEEHKHIEANKIYATSHPCSFEPEKLEKWSIDYLRSKFLIKNVKKIKKYEKIFIFRDQARLLNKNNLKKYVSHRILINEIEIKDFLISKGFHVIKPEEFSFKKQILIFSNAKYIVSLFGAAMMMLAFCKKNTKVLEIKPKKSGSEFLNISKKLKLQHKQIKIEPSYKSSIPQNGLIFCNLKLIKKNLNLLGLK